MGPGGFNFLYSIDSRDLTGGRDIMVDVSRVAITS